MMSLNDVFKSYRVNDSVAQKGKCAGMLYRTSGLRWQRKRATTKPYDMALGKYYFCHWAPLPPPPTSFKDKREALNG